MYINLNSLNVYEFIYIYGEAKNHHFFVDCPYNYISCRGQQENSKTSMKVPIKENHLKGEGVWQNKSSVQLKTVLFLCLSNLSPYISPPFPPKTIFKSEVDLRLKRFWPHNKFTYFITILALSLKFKRRPCLWFKKTVIFSIN